MDPYEEIQVLAKQISAVHKEIVKLYKMMSIRNEEYYWTVLEKQIDNQKAKATELCSRMKDARYRFANWQPQKEEPSKSGG